MGGRGDGMTDIIIISLLLYIIYKIEKSSNTIYGMFHVLRDAMFELFEKYDGRWKK